MKKLFIFILCSVISLHAYAWSRTEHMLIAEIAYDRLTPFAKHEANHTIHALDQRYKRTNFVRAATWADDIKWRVNRYNRWHYINTPYSTDGTRLPRVGPKNIVWAIDNAERMLRDPWESEIQKGYYLRYLIHFVGDIHQPLHCITRVTRHHPYGDGGGNGFYIRDPLYDNLHAFWDHGAHAFDTYRKPKSKHIRQLAEKLTKQYPPSYFKQRLHQMDPHVWANEGYDLARSVAYDIRQKSKPSKDYIKRSQKVVSEQIVLAGYRLAEVLNQIFIIH